MSNVHVALSPRQRYLVLLVCLGMPNKAIAGSMGVVTGTVKNYLRIVYEKLGVTTKLELACVATKEYLRNRRLSLALRCELYDEQEWEFLQEYIAKHDATPEPERRAGWLEENRVRFATLLGWSLTA